MGKTEELGLCFWNCTYGTHKICSIYIHKKDNKTFFFKKRFSDQEQTHNNLIKTCQETKNGKVFSQID